MLADLATFELQLEAELYRRSFADYAVRFWPVVTGVPMQPNRATEAVIAVLQRVADGELWRVLIAMPPGVGKSTLLALYAGWRLARNPRHRAIHAMHSFELAGTESLRVRRLVESDEHRALFPAIVLQADESTKATWALTAGGRYYAVGVDTAILGRRCDEAVIDDPLDAHDRHSLAAREALRVWFDDALYSRLDGDRAPIVVCHQRLCIDDLIGQLAEQKDPDGEPLWHVLELPAEDEDGTLLAPTILSREKCEDLKRKPRTWQTMYLQRPSADDGAAIARSAWRFHAPAGANPAAPRPSGCTSHEQAPTVITPLAFALTVISVDPTFGATSSTADYCAIHVWSAAGAGRYLRDRWKKKSKQAEQRAQIKAYRAKYPGARVLVEKSAAGHGYIEELIADGITNVVPVVPRGAKAERLENVSPTIDLGCAYLLLGMHDLAGFVEELAGATRHDDDQDACSQALHYLNVRMAKLGYFDGGSSLDLPRGAIIEASAYGTSDAAVSSSYGKLYSSPQCPRDCACSRCSGGMW